MYIQRVYLSLHDVFCNILIFVCVYVKIQLLTVSFLPQTRLDI